MSLQQQPQAETESVPQVPEAVQSSRATIIYSDDLANESLDDLEDEDLDVSGDEVGDDDEFDVDLDSLPEDPEEGEEEFAEGSKRFEQFREDFNKAFGLPLDEAKVLIQDLRAEQQKRQINEDKYVLSTEWNVPVKEVEARLAVVAKMWKTLPPDKQQAYDSVKGAQILWNQHSSRKSKSSANKVSSTMGSTAKPSTGQPRWLYTQKQIDNMDMATYSAEAQKIMLAYAQGKVKR